MTRNSFIIAADAARARLFRTAQTPAPDAPIELIEMDGLEAGAGLPAGEPDAVLRHTARVAATVARFALYHVCNPVIVAAPHAVCSAILSELERALPDVHVVPIVSDLVNLPRAQILRELTEQRAFVPLQYPDRTGLETRL